MRDLRRFTMSLLLAMALVASFALVACGGDDDDDDTGGGDETPTTGATEPAGESPTEADGETPDATEPAGETPTEDTGGGGDIGTVEVMSVWGGGGEQESFEAVVEPWSEETGGDMEYTGTRDLTQQLTVRVEGGNPPDVAIPPEVGLMQDFAAEGEIVPLSQCEGLEEMVRENYGEAFIDFGTVDGELYGIVFKVSNKGTIFYDPAFFEENNLEPLTADSTWEDLVALAEQVRDEAGVPAFSIGMESAEATGWVGTDWIAQILLAQAGLETYNGVVDGSVPFTDPAVQDAWERWGQIVHGEGLVLQDVPAGVLATTFQASTYPPFEDPPEAGMVYLGSFALGFITEQFPDAVPGEDVDFMPFPGGAITGDFNIAYMFNSDESTCSFMEHIASADAQQIWLERGGYTSANQNIDTSAYENEVERSAAEAVLEASVFAGDMDDLVGGQWQQAFWAAVTAYLQDQGQLESLLESVEASRTE